MFLIIPQRKHHAKPFELKLIQQRKFLCTLEILEKVKQASEALKVKIALPQRNEKIFLTGKKSFLQEGWGNYLKKKLFAVETI